MLQLDPTLAGRSTAQGKLSKLTIKQDGDSDHTLSFTTSIVFRLASSADAAQADKIVPGALTAYERATDEGNDWKSRFMVDPHFENVNVNLKNPARPEDTGLEFSASCRQVGLRCSKKSVALEYRFTSGGQPAGAAARFAELLGRIVEVSVGWENVLPFTKLAGGVPGAVAEPPKFDTSTLVAATLHDGDEVFGLFLRFANESEEDDGDLVIRDLDGTETLLANQDVVAVHQLSADEDNTKLLRAYKAKCTKNGISPSARALILALAPDGGAEKSDAGTWLLTKACMDHAFQLTSQPVQQLPPEPGEGDDQEAAEG